MKKLLLFFGLLMGTAGSIFASPLTPQQALSRVKGGLTSYATISQSEELKMTLTDSKNDATVYVFDNASKKGFMVVSADDATIPLLGYADSGSFDALNIPPALNYWLEYYNQQITEIRESQSVNLISDSYPTSVDPSWTAIDPLVATKWNQDSPYNDMCILTLTSGSEIKCVTGCVATAMAQVMKYHNYPVTGQGSISYKPYSNAEEMSMDFSQTTFDWANMLNSYSGTYTDEQANAVALLMKACGYSVKMAYSNGESGASSGEIAGALINYFKYSNTTQLVDRAYYTTDEWTALIYNNLKEYGPVIYDGSSMTGGHSFICDGYDGNGYFHFNWGWGGMSDGYFLLDNLNPSSQGIGGFAGGYNIGQDAIVGIQPASGEDVSLPVELILYGSLTGTISDNSLNLTTDSYAQWGYNGVGQCDVNFGVMVEKEIDSSFIKYIEANNLKNIQLSTNHYLYNSTCNITLSADDFVTGEKYKVTLATKDNNNANSEWMPLRVEPGNYNYVYITYSNGEFSVVNNEPATLSVSDFSVTPNPVYFGLPVLFKAKFINDSPVQISRNISVYLIDEEGNNKYTTENIFITIDANSTLEKEWTSTSWYFVNGSSSPTVSAQYTFKLHDNDNNEFLDQTGVELTLEPEAPEAQFTATISIDNAEIDESSNSYYTWYVVKGKTFTLNLDLNVTEGYFSKAMEAIIMASRNDGSGYYDEVLSQTFPTVPMITGPAEENYKTTINFSDAEYGVGYMLSVYSGYSSITQTIMVEFQESEEDPDQPETPTLPTAIPSLSTGSEIELESLSSISVRWGENNLELINPGQIRVVNNETELTGFTVGLSSYTSAGETGSNSTPTVYEEGQLTITFPQDLEIQPGTLKITIPANTVNVIVEDSKLPNTEISLSYTLTETSVGEIGVFGGLVATPAEGLLYYLGLDELILTWNQEVEIDSDNSIVTLTIGTTSYSLEATPCDQSGNTVTSDYSYIKIDLSEVEGNYGLYIISIPEGLVKNEDGDVNESAYLEYNVVGIDNNATVSPVNGYTCTTDDQFESIKVEWNGEISFFDQSQSITWNNSNISPSDVALIDNVLEIYVGELTEGEYTLTIPQGFVSINGSYINGPVTSTYTITAVPEPEPVIPVEEIILFPTDQQVMTIGSSLEFSAYVLPANATNPDLTWSFTDSSIAFLIESDETPGNMILTAVREGSTTLIVTSKDNPNVQAFCQIEVVDPTYSLLQVYPEELVIPVLQRTRLHVLRTDTWQPVFNFEMSSSDPSVASVSDGYIFANSIGECIITVSAEIDGVTYTDTCQVIVVYPTSSGIESIFNESEKINVYDMTGKAIKLNADVETIRYLEPGLYIIQQGNKQVKIKI